MASVHLDQKGEYVDDTHVQKSLPSDLDDFREAEVSPGLPFNSCDAVGTFGEPEILPRIGDEYQVELPQLIGEFDGISHPNKSTYRETRADAEQKFLVGLPIKLTWIDSVERGILGSCSSSTHSDSKNIIKTEISFVELGPSDDSSKSMEETENLPFSDKICKGSGPGYSLIPGLYDENWSAAERDCFLLGLYIFEKNFVEVRQFVETKDMRALLSYYYGKFYCSAEYCRWSECRKTKNKKAIFGQRLFSGLRQQELLSRILPRVSEDCQNALLEISRTFGDEKMSLADYVLSLKAMIGTNTLVEAVGIGKGKHDLTGMALEFSRSNQVVHMRREIPTGNACSSLTTTEIIEVLNGDYRLSKARSNDLFWEAVWPRLLARGWHSEQPKNQGYFAGSDNSLVFLIPGIKKFSRRKLVKGDQYFDSVTDVLSRVAREPGLIELDAEVDGSKRREECEFASERNSKPRDDDRPTSQRNFYLHPMSSNCSTVVMKFTVVDTSLSDSQVREQRTLPSEILDAFIGSDHTEDSDDDDTPEENIDESDTTNIIMLDALAADVSPETTKSDEQILPGKKGSKASAMDQDAHLVCPAISSALVTKENKKDLHENTQPRKVSESLLSRMLEQENIDYRAPITKRSWTSIGCSQGESQAGLLPNHCSDNNEITEHLLSQVSQPRDNLPSSSSLRGSPRENIENTQTHMLVDLNLPQVSPVSENSSFAIEFNDEQEITSNLGNDHLILNSDVLAESTEQSNLNPRRQSRRIRPLTTRALEAVAHGYLTVNRRAKRKVTSSSNGQASRPSQRACGAVRHNESTNSVPAAENNAADASYNQLFI